MALTYTIFAIASFPEVERRVLEEVDAFWCGPYHPSALVARPAGRHRVLGNSWKVVQECLSGACLDPARYDGWTNPAHGCDKYIEKVYLLDPG